MKDRPWYKHYPEAFLNGTQGLGPAVIGCYVVVLDMIYDRGGPVPNDTHLIGARLGCSARMARSLIDRLLSTGKLFEAPGGLTNMRAETEIYVTVTEARKSRENGANGGRTRAINAGQSLRINGIAQARLKPPSSIARVLETTRKKEGSSEKPASEAELLTVSPALAAKYTASKPPAVDPLNDPELEIPEILRRA